MTDVVVDTNVLIAANGGHERASAACRLSCIESLEKARKGRVLIDDGQRILGEYKDYCSFAGEPGGGDAFFKWLWDNQVNPKHCRQVSITSMRNSETDFEEYPEDPELAGFDPSDRKFIAVACGSGADPDVLQATDSKWWPLRNAFQRNGVRIRFLCPELMGKEQ
ncbi:MAG: PIN domain-containing protein [Anaerolineae bacterium]|nr:PIN domain-containing protein [Anaerolineae bacterium]